MNKGRRRCSPPPEFRRGLASHTTRGALAGTVHVHIADVPAGGWDAL